MRTLLIFGAVTVVAGSALAVAPAPPSAAIAYAPNEDRVHLSWVDNSNDETGFKVERYDFTSSVWGDAADLPPNFEVYRSTAPSPAAQQVKYRVAAVKGTETSAWVEAEVFKPAGNLDLFHDPSRSDPATGAPPLEIPEGSGARAGQSISIQIEVSNGTPERFIAEGLPAGLSLASTTGLISGTVQTPGVYRILNGVEFDSGKRFQQVRYLRVLPAASTPVIANAIELPVQNVGAEGFIDISGIFADPSRPFGAWFFVGGESIIVALFDTATPKTVANFIAYAYYGAYNGSYVYRAISDFVVQGGGYGPASAAAAPNQWASVATLPPVFNEPGISNSRATISMAKSSGVRDSATSEWFFNVGSSNPAILDNQNGGFAAFGAVVGSYGLSVVDAIANLRKGNYNVSVQGQGSGVFENVPVLEAAAPLALGSSSLLRVESVSLCPPVVITIVGNSAPSVLDAGVVGMLLYLKSKGPLGTANLQLRATNLDGNSVDFLLPVRIDDKTVPGLKVLSLRSGKSSGTARIKAKATDTLGLGSWNYRINGGRWIKGGDLKGKTAVVSEEIQGLKQGKNRIEFEVRDARGNRSEVIKETVKVK